MSVDQGTSVFDPITALAECKGRGILAVIIGIQGPSYRSLGALMAILPDGRRVGSLSSGCIEFDIVEHASKVMTTGQVTRILYGQGSPYIDIQLPCGGGLEILLIPAPGGDVMNALIMAHNQRVPQTLCIDVETGDTSVQPEGETGSIGTQFLVRLQPEVFFYVFGKGPEASAFTSLVQATGFETLLLSPDRETLDLAGQSNCATRHLKSAAFPPDLAPDQWSAVVLFFHDHDWEPPILISALESPAFYIGSQGSRKTRDTRLAALRKRGVSDATLARLKGPIGLIPSVRDARTLAVSVLAEILTEAE